MCTTRVRGDPKDMTSTTLISGILSILILAWLLTNQLRLRPLRSLRRRSTIGIALIVGGIFQALPFLQTHPLNALDFALLALSLLIGMGLATVRARTINFFPREDRLYIRGTWLTAALWIVGIAQHLLMDALITPGLGMATLTLYFGPVLLAQAAVVSLRARRLEPAAA